MPFSSQFEFFLFSLCKNEPRITDTYRRLTGKQPTALVSFIVREKSILSLPR
jgi:hypothetical protein